MSAKCHSSHRPRPRTMAIRATSRHNRAVHVGIQARGRVSGDRRVVDRCRGDREDSASRADAERMRAPLAPWVAVPPDPPTLPPEPEVADAPAPATPPVPASALLAVIRSVALDCLEPFFVCSRGSITSVVAFAL